MYTFAVKISCTPIVQSFPGGQYTALATPFASVREMYGETLPRAVPLGESVNVHSTGTFAAGSLLEPSTVTEISSRWYRRYVPGDGLIALTDAG